MKKKKRISFISGLLIILINLYWVWYSFGALYRKRYSEIEYSFVEPNKTLFIYAIFGMIGILIGLKVIRRKLHIRKGLTYCLVVLIAGILFGHILSAR